MGCNSCAFILSLHFLGLFAESALSTPKNTYEVELMVMNKASIKVLIEDYEDSMVVNLFNAFCPFRSH
ncbi:MAG: hypothetical protein OXC03_06620 [Flavobacteriaceae bacterium]|nr:hypothetical protein [Flavobacteriaceae bacterium]